MEKVRKGLDLTGQLFGYLTVIEYTGTKKDLSFVWKCQCKCGNFHLANSKHLKRGAVTSCGCKKNEKNPSKGRPYKGEDLTGKQFGYLTVLKYAYSDKFHHRRWECQCCCGNITFVESGSLNGGNTKSCGCKSMKSGRLSGEEVYNYTGYKEITGSRWYSMKNGAESRDLEFSITKEDIWNLYLKQNEKCYYTNLPVSFKDSTASVDRTDSALGYTIDNVRIVHKSINRMKMSLSEEYFIHMCIKVADNIRSKNLQREDVIEIKHGFKPI
jgi:hypothetical protein